MYDVKFVRELAKILLDHSVNIIINRNVKLTEELAALRRVRIVYTHNDATFAFGCFADGDLIDSIVVDHVMYSVPLSINRFETMTVNTLGMIKIEVGCCDFVSVKDASEIALWNVNHNNAHDNDNSVTGAMEMRMMLGTNSKHIILTLVFEDLTHFEINALKTQVLTYCSDAQNYADSMSKGSKFLRKLMYSDESVYKDKRIRIVNIAFRLSSVQRMVESMNRDSDFVDVFGRWLLRDKNSISFKRQIAKLLRVEPPGIRY